MSFFLLGLLQFLDDPFVDPEQLHAILALNDNLLALAEEILCLANNTGGCWWFRCRGGVETALRGDRSSRSSLEYLGEILDGCWCRVDRLTLALG